MAINPNSVGSSAGSFPAQGTRQARVVDTDSKIREATLTSAEKLSPGEITEHQNFYNKTVGDIDGIRGGVVGGCIGLDPSVLDKLFPHRQDDKKVDQATAPNFFDNKQAESLRSDYKKVYKEAQRERARASREADKLGPGDHELSNGDKVNVSIDKKSGKKTVTTTQPDGTTKTVSFDPKNPNSVDVTTRHPDGRTEKLHQDGTSVSKEKTDAFGQTTGDKFSLNQEGDPVREHTGPGEDDYLKTTANDDGSTDTRNLIYREEGGEPVYEDKHEEPGWKFPKPFPPPPGPWPPIGPILPHPWWRDRQPDDGWDRARVPELVPFRSAQQN